MVVVVLLVVAVSVRFTAFQRTPRSAGGAADPTPEAAAPIERERQLRAERSHSELAPDASAATVPDGCALTVRVLTDAGEPLEGVLVSLAAGRPIATDADGRADVGLVPSTATPEERTVRLRTATLRHEATEHVVQPPPGARRFEAVLRVEVPAVPVLVLRLAPTEPRLRSLRLRRDDQPWHYAGEVPPGVDTVRIPLPPPRRPVLRLETRCPGFADAGADVGVPDAPGDFVAVLALHPGGLPAWGRVVERDGAAAVGAEVVAYRERGPLHEAGRVESGADGRFPIENWMRDASLVAIREGIACSAWLDITPAEVVLHLGRGATVQGTVRESNGAPAAGAMVWIHVALHSADSTRREVLTDDAGRYQLAGIPEGWWIRPSVMFRNHYGPAPDGPSPFVDPRAADAMLARGEAHVAAGDGDVFRRDLVARRFPSALYSFRLELPDGERLPERVTLYFAGSSRDVVVIDPGDPRVTVELDGGEPQRVEVRAGRLVGVSEAVVPQDREDRDDLVIELRALPRVVAQLVGARELPGVRQVEVIVGEVGDDGGHGTGSAPVDENGRSDITALVPAPQQLDAAADEDSSRALVLAVRGPGVVSAEVLGPHANLRLPCRRLAALLRAGGEEVVVEVPLHAPARVPVVVLDGHRGEPVHGVELAVRPPDTIGPERVTTDPAGRAEIQLLRFPDEKRQSLVELEAVSPFSGHARMEVTSLAALLSRGEPWTVSVSRLATFPAVLRDDLGRPLAGVEVRLGSEVVGTTDAGGRIDLDLPLGAAATIQIVGFAPRAVQVPLAPQRLDVAMDALRTVWVGIQVPADAPQKYLVHAMGEDGRALASMGTPAPVGGQTETSVRVPWRDSCALRVVSDDRSWGAFCTAPPDVLRVEVTVAQRTRQPVRIQVVDAAGAPFPRTDVRVSLAESSSSWVSPATTDESGEIRLDLYGGTYRLAVQLGQGRNATPVALHVPEYAPPAEVVQVVVR